MSYIIIDVGPEYDGVDRGATKVYEIDTPEQERAAREALRDAGCFYARVHTDHPDDPSSYETRDLILAAER